MYENSSRIGSIGEAVALTEFTKRGYNVLIPFSENCPYDLVVDKNGKLIKIQCKTTEHIKNNCMEFSICRSNGFTYKKEQYNQNEIDFIFVYCLENDYMGLIPIHETNQSTTFTIRLSQPKNNQKKGVHLYSDYEFNNKVDTL